MGCLNAGFPRIVVCWWMLNWDSSNGLNLLLNLLTVICVV